MKRIAFFLIVIMTVTITTIAESAIRIGTASDVRRGILTLEGTVTPENGMDVEVMNHDPKDTIEVDPITLGMQPEDGSNQAVGFTTAQEIAPGAYLLSLRPGQRRRIRLKWQCLQQHKSSPGAGARYSGLPVSLPPFAILALKAGVSQTQVWQILNAHDPHWLERARIREQELALGRFQLRILGAADARSPQCALAYRINDDGQAKYLAIAIEPEQIYILPAGYYYLWRRPENRMQPVRVVANQQTRYTIHARR